MSEAQDDISVKEVYSKAWDLTKKYSNVWTGLALVYILPVIILSLIFRVNNSSFSTTDGQLVESAGLAMIGVVAIAIYQLVVIAVFIKATIEAANGKDLKDVKQAYEIGKTTAGPVIIATFAVAAVVAAGLLLLIVPGIIAAFLLFLTVYIVADKKVSIYDAMKLSAEHAKQQVGTIFKYVALAILISLVGGMVASIFGGFGILSNMIETTINAITQIFISISGAVLYVEIMKRHKTENTDKN
jgi:hypothetical protein